MTFLQHVLEPPSYGFKKADGSLYVPSKKEIFSEFFSRTNIFKTPKNWLSFVSWSATLSLIIPFAIFLIYFFSWKLMIFGLAYSMIVMGTHGTIYLHRYSTHRAFKFTNSVYLFFARNLSFKVIPEEIYVISHHVHHQFSEQPGDPYNVHGGWLYCFLSDVNHHPIARNLSEKDYLQLTRLMNHTGVKVNSYAQYQRWGSLAHPARTVAHYALNWAAWFGIFYAIGGPSVAFAIFGMAVIWAFGVRTFNYDGHGGGKDKRVDGVDFNRRDLSINQLWPGYVSGEWHNNHHLYPNGARAGFLWYQLDLAWIFVRVYSLLGGISTYRDYKREFYRDYYRPYLESQKQKRSAAVGSA